MKESILIISKIDGLELIKFHDLNEYIILSWKLIFCRCVLGKL